MAGRNYFNPEGLVWKPLGKLGELVTLSLLWGVCSIPVLTAGAAAAALYDCTVHCLRRGEEELFGRFFRTLRRELRAALPAWALWLGLLAVPPLLLWVLARRRLEPGAFAVAEVWLLVAFLFLLGAACWVFPLLSRFTFPGVPALCAAALRLACGHILRTAALGILTAAAALLCLRLAAPLIFVPGLTALLWSFLLEPVFARYGGG